MYLLVADKVIIAMSDKYEQVDNGILINGHVYPEGEIHEAEVAEEVIPQKYKFTKEKGVHLNQQWVQSVEQEKKKAIEDYTLELINDETISVEKIGVLHEKGHISKEVFDSVAAMVSSEIVKKVE